MLHLPQHATQTKYTADGNGGAYLDYGNGRLVGQERGRNAALLDSLGRFERQRPPLSPVSHHENAPPDNNASSGAQETRSLLGKRKVGDIRTDDHDHEHLALDAAGNACTDYQTCGDLWDALSSAFQRADDATSTPATRAYVHFRGTYAFVADPKVPPRRRVELVSKDLRRFAKLQYGDLMGELQQQNADGWTETYRCECSRNRTRNLPPAIAPRPPPIPVPSFSMPPRSQKATLPQTSQMLKCSVHAPPATQSNPPVPAAPAKRTPTQSTLAGWLTGTNKSTKAPPVPGPRVPASTQAVGHSERPAIASCDGRLHITVEEIAHPLGYYTGQKVIVVLEHPER